MKVNRLKSTKELTMKSNHNHPWNKLDRNQREKLKHITNDNKSATLITTLNNSNKANNNIDSIEQQTASTRIFLYFQLASLIALII